MKKIFLLSLLFVNTFSGASYKLRFFGKTVFLEWFEMTISVILIVLAAVLISMIIISLQKYKCPKCGAVISPKWYHISAGLHMGSDRVIKCPHCGRKGFCRRAD